MRSLRLLSSTLLGAALAGCSLATGPDGGRVVGILHWTSAEPAAELAASSVHFTEPSVLEVPDTVDAGAPFDITVRTYGANGCWREAGVEVASSGLTLAITPYDRDGQEPGIMCTEAIVRLPRVVRVSFPRPGQATVRVTGRKILDGSGSAPREEALTIEKTVVVR